MGRKKSGPRANAFDLYTQACPKMTRRWNPEVVPEIAAWLLTIRGQCERAFEAAARSAMEDKTDESAANCSRIYTKMKTCEELVSRLYDKWSDYAWWEAVTVVHSAIDIRAGRPIHTPTIPGMIDGVAPASPEDTRGT